jgi:hypothetical protein
MVFPYILPTGIALFATALFGRAAFLYTARSRTQVRIAKAAEHVCVGLAMLAISSILFAMQLAGYANPLSHRGVLIAVCLLVTGAGVGSVYAGRWVANRWMAGQPVGADYEEDDGNAVRSDNEPPGSR